MNGRGEFLRFFDVVSTVSSLRAAQTRVSGQLICNAVRRTGEGDTEWTNGKQVSLRLAHSSRPLLFIYLFIGQGSQARSRAVGDKSIRNRDTTWRKKKKGRTSYVRVLWIFSFGFFVVRPTEQPCNAPALMVTSRPHVRGREGEWGGAAIRGRFGCGACIMYTYFGGCGRAHE